MRRFILALAALAAASCNADKPTDQDVANIATALQGSTSGFPKLESARYCARFAAAADAQALEKDCNEQEAAARKKAMAMTIPAITMSYCTKTAEAIGGSYQAFKLCVEKEQEPPL